MPIYNGIDTYSTLVLHGDGTDGSTLIVDSSLYGKAVTTVGTVQIDTAQKVFGTGSILFDGAGDSLSLADSADWDLGAGDFTVDMRVMSSLPALNMQLVGQWVNADTNNAWAIWLTGGAPRYLSFFYTTNGTTAVQLFTTPTIADNTWAHLAVVRGGNNLYFFVNGTQDGVTKDVTGITISNSTKVLGIGGDSSNGQSYNGWIDEFRISKGVARWTANFTPPTKAYSTDAYYGRAIMISD